MSSSNIGNYEETYRGFRWEIPETFNFGRDVVDRYAEDLNRIALLWEDKAGHAESFSFAAIKELSDAAGRVLQGLGIGKGDAVLVMLPRIPLWQSVIVGLLKIGAIAIPCTVGLRSKDIVYRARHSKARAIVTVPEKAEEIEDVRRSCPTLEHALVSEGERKGWIDLGAATQAPGGAPDPVTTRSDEPALVYYTSGTTGNPKAVMHNHAYTAAQRFTSEYWHDYRESELLYTASDTGWAKAAYGVLFGPWNVGAKVLMVDGAFDAQRELSLIEKYRVNVYCGPPTVFRMLVKEDLSRYEFPDLRHCTSAGEPLNPEVIKIWREAYGITIHDGYGQTETILLVGNFQGMEVKPGSMGKPMPGHEVGVIDEEGRPLPPGEPGDIALRGKPPSLFKEYWKDPDETASSFRGEWYVTGDRAYVDEDGYFWFVARSDDVIISAGYRIGPFEVESALLEHEAVLEAAAVSSPDEIRGAVVKAFVCLRPGCTPSEDLAAALQDHVKRVTAPYKYPRKIEFVDDLPKTVSGKIRRVELREKEWEGKGG